MEVINRKKLKIPWNGRERNYEEIVKQLTEESKNVLGRNYKQT